MIALRLAYCSTLLATALSGDQLPYRTFTVADGLVRSTIKRVRKDSKGFLWICTAEGLALFDGANFTNYGVREGLPDRVVNDLAELRDGSYVLATGAGVCRFRPRRALAAGQNADPRFEPIPRAEGGAESMVVTMQDRDGTIWAGGRGGLYRNLPGSPALERVELLPSAHIVLSLHQDKQGNIWAGTTEGLYRVDERGRQAVRVYEARDVDAIHSEQDGRLWIGEWGLTHLDPRAQPPAVIEHLGGETSPVLSQRVFAISEDPRGGLWVAGAGIARLESDPSRRERVRGLALPPGWNEFVSSLECRGAAVWAGVGRMGLIALSDTGFSSYGKPDGLEEMFAGMFVGRQHPVVVTYTNGGFAWNDFDGRRFTRSVPKVPASVRSVGWGVGGVVLQSMDKEWWQVSDAGLLHYARAEDPSQLNGRMPIGVITGTNGLPDGVVLQLFEDSGGNLWAGTLSGVTRRERKTGKWRPRRSQELAGVSKSVETFAEDRSGTVWMGVSGAGLLRYRGGRFERVTRGIPKIVNDLFVDSRGRLWIASSGEGLAMIAEPACDDPQVRYYGAGNGLRSSELFAVNEDGRGRMYVAGGRGVDRLDVETGRVHHLTGELEIRGETEHIFRDASGALWFEAATALTRYVPRQEEPAWLPQPMFRGIRVAGERRIVSDLGEKQLSGIPLKPGETSLDVDMETVRMYPGEKIQYQYRMGSEGASWSEPSSAATISLAGLGAGKYRISVRAIFASGAVSPTFADLTFEAEPHLWARWWFRALLLAGAIGAAAMFHRIRVARLVEMARVRSRIAADLHDDIGASLSQVALLSEVTRRRSHDAASVEKQSEKISTICRELLESTSDIVWAVDSRHDHLVDLTRRMREFGSALVESEEIAFGLEVPPSVERLRLGIDLRRQAYFIFKEALSNTVRHSGANRISARLEVEGHWLRLEVRDNGAGNGASGRMAPGGNGMTNMRRRAEEMGGSFRAERQEGSGYLVEARLPIQ
jgi:signal transduction histidine kinase/ligand-binding sensor domain-containing protein